MNEQIVYENIDRFYNMFDMNQTEIIKDIINYMKSRDDILVLKFPNNLGISGMVMIKKDRSKEYKCIYINTNEPLGRQSFSFVHELYHIYFENAPREVCLKRDSNPIEKRAEIFASNILIPRIQLLLKLREYRCSNTKKLSLSKVFRLQRYFNASFQAIIYAIESLNNDSRYTKYSKFVPNIDSDLKKYYTNWEELEKITLEMDPGNHLNSPTKQFEFPEDFKNDIIANYNKNLVSFEEANIIFDFFNQNFKDYIDR